MIVYSITSSYPYTLYRTSHNLVLICLRYMMSRHGKRQRGAFYIASIAGVAHPVLLGGVRKDKTHWVSTNARAKSVSTAAAGTCRECTRSSFCCRARYTRPYFSWSCESWWFLVADVQEYSRAQAQSISPEQVEQFQKMQKFARMNPSYFSLNFRA